MARTPFDWADPFGLDARDPHFWQGGLGVIERLIGELEELDRAG